MWNLSIWERINSDVVSLDTKPRVKARVMEWIPAPEEEVIQHIQNEDLYKALRSIPRKQADWIYAHYFMDRTLEKITNAEDTTIQAIYYSIQTWKKNLKQILKNILFET